MLRQKRKSDKRSMLLSSSSQRFQIQSTFQVSYKSKSHSKKRLAAQLTNFHHLANSLHLLPALAAQAAPENKTFKLRSISVASGSTTVILF